VIFLSKDGKCLWDGSSEHPSVHAGGIIGALANHFARQRHLLARIFAVAREIGRLAAARMQAHPESIDVKPGCAAPIC
jgi:hypothetical protein